MQPDNPIHAVTHPDPYPYYARLRAGPALLRDEKLSVWIASSTAAVTAVLANPACRVRPAAEPTPNAIAGTPAGDIFGRLIRMNDGAAHAMGKSVIQRALAGLDRTRVRRMAEQAASRRWSADPDDWTGFAFDTPLYVVAGLLGFGEDDQARIAGLARNFVACLSPLSSAAELQAASNAASELRAAFEARLDQGESTNGPLFQALVEEARKAGWADREVLSANLVGLLSQTCDASAGWIGLSLATRLTHPQLVPALRESQAALQDFVDEVARYEAVTHNTRRFVSKDTRILDVDVREGDVILVVLAAANRDPAVNPMPERFLLERENRRVFTFGHGPHLCPGQALARSIVTGAVGHVLTVPLPDAGAVAWTYKSLPNIRIPVFCSKAEVLA